MSYTAPTVVASGTTFAQFQAGGASGHLELLITAQAATAGPDRRRDAGRNRRRLRRHAGRRRPITSSITEPTASAKRPPAPASTSQVDHGPARTCRHVPDAEDRQHEPQRLHRHQRHRPVHLYASGITTATLRSARSRSRRTVTPSAPPTVNTTGLTYTDANGNVHDRRSSCSGPPRTGTSRTPTGSCGRSSAISTAAIR